MTAVERVRQTQRSLSFVTGLGALLWGVAAGFGTIIIGLLLGLLIAFPPVFGVILPVLAVLVGLGTAAALLWRWRFAWSFDRVALWIEERAPQLRYALVTAVDPRYKESSSFFDGIVSKVDTAPFVRTAAKHSVLPALAAAAVAVAAFIFMPTNVKESVNMRNVLGGGSDKAVVVGNRLTDIQATITPPRYTGRPAQTLTDPSTITGLRGSTVVLRGEGIPDGLTAELQTTDSAPPRQLAVRADGDGWAIDLALTDTIPAALRLNDVHTSRIERYTKMIVIDPRVDEIPMARLLLPVRDTTLRVVSGNLVLSAQLTDDIGLSRAEFEWIVTKTDGGETAEYTTGTLAKTSLNGRSTGEIQTSIPYAKLNLSEGAMLSIRAAVYDNNTLYGPGKGVSETRTIRIATKGEYDTINVNAAPPSADTALLSLKMLIIATEKLEKARPFMERKPFVDSAYRLGAEASRIQGLIRRIMDEQTGGGEIDADPRLVIALDAMYEAVRAFQIAETGEALPHLRRALKAIEEYAKSERYIYRGPIRIPPVNIDRVRLTGTDTGTAKPRTPRLVEGQDRDRLMADYTRAMTQFKIAPDSAIEVLTLMRVSTLRKYPDVAAALGEAVAKIEAKEDPSVPLTQVRRGITGNVDVVSSLPVWSGAW